MGQVRFITNAIFVVANEFLVLLSIFIIKSEFIYFIGSDGYLSPICANPQFLKNVKEDDEGYILANNSTTQSNNEHNHDPVDKEIEGGDKGT